MPEIKLPQVALPDLSIPTVTGDAEQRAKALKELLDRKRAEIAEKTTWYAVDSEPMRALRAQEKQIQDQLDAAVPEALAAVDAQIAAIDRAIADGQRQGLLPAHPEMQKLAKARDDAVAHRFPYVWPFGSSEACRRQEEAAAAMGVPVEKVLDLGNGVTMKLVLVPAGEFMMGSPASEAQRDDDEGPQHRVRITKPFYMGKYEVTQAQWQAVMGSNPSYFRGDGRLPVEQVSWDDCQAFLQKAGNGLRLPTEAEWEYACRAGTAAPFSFGWTVTPQQANYDGTYTYGGGPVGVYRRTTVPVGSFPPNPWGLCDMHGNVWEWCADWYGQDCYAAGDANDPRGPASGQYHVLRGGTWGHEPRNCRSADRRESDLMSWQGKVGFRVVAGAGS